MVVGFQVRFISLACFGFPPPFSGARNVPGFLFHLAGVAPGGSHIVNGLPYTRMARDQVAKTADEPQEAVEVYMVTPRVGWMSQVVEGVKKIACLVILLVTFLGWLSDPLKG